MQSFAMTFLSCKQRLTDDRQKKQTANIVAVCLFKDLHQVYLMTLATLVVPSV